ncbi:hypothetical protein T07_12742 [Trichinella nelsoni]|uniref:Uncharacterized protein n=1 Tax=Trichinella nelsoni TaxID=6336 RepID=A0A0V0RK42_9BILA|nr:hypothetical protein T07_12742 [Trichinella nelsoni]
MQEVETVTVDLYNNLKADRRTLVFISPGNSHIHETVEKKTRQFVLAKIESIACIYMAVKDQGAASDETHENAQSSELSAKLLTHHNFFKHMKYARNPNKLKWTL